MKTLLLFERIEAKVAEFEMRMGEAPEFIYMGTYELDALKQFHRYVGSGGASYSSVPERLKGLRVLPVKIEQHLAVS